MFKKIFLLIVVVLISLQVVFASEITTSFPETITLVDKPISVNLYVSNSSSTTQTFTLTSYTAPYPSVFSENTIVLSPNTTRQVSLRITPLTGQLESTYNSSIEIRSAVYYKKISFQILQKANRTCPIDLQYFVSYIKESGNYKLELIFKNTSNRDEVLDVIGLKDINLSQPIGEIAIPKAVESSTIRLFKTDLKETELEYRCQGIYATTTIELPDKDEIEPETKSIFTGLLALTGTINLESMLNSTIFQIILIFILIILVLSFSTKYIKYVYKK